MTRPMRWFAALPGLILLLAACATPQATASPADEPEPTETAPTETAPSETEPGAGGEETSVTISGFSFGDDITVPAGTTVTFINEDSAAHTVTHGTDGNAAADAAFDQEVGPGESVEITFDEAGEFRVTCTFHPSMNMTVTVEG